MQTPSFIAVVGALLLIACEARLEADASGGSGTNTDSRQGPGRGPAAPGGAGGEGGAGNPGGPDGAGGAGGRGNPGDPGDPGDPGNGDGPGDRPREPFIAAETMVRRLSQAEIDNTLRHLVGDETAPAGRFLPEDEFTPFDNDYTRQQASGALIDALDGLAADVAARLVADPDRLAAVLPCQPEGAGDSACLKQFIETFGRLALRRPLGEEEVEAYLTLQAFATEQVPGLRTGFHTAVELVVRALLQDPEFLYRVEAGTPTDHPGVFALDDYAIASRLAFLLWGSAPDDGLLDDAAAGTLSAPEGRREVAARMLADPRARAQLHRFHAQWLGYRAIPVPGQLAEAFSRETAALIDRVVFDEHRSYLDLFRIRETWADPALAEHYGLPPAPEGGGWVPYDDPQRAGILSHGSVLAAHSKGFSDTSPTQRGKFIQERLACTPIPPPPPNVVADAPPGDGESACKTQRYIEHAENPGCAGCHQLMDPIGFGLEQFDLMGRRRAHDDGLPDCAIEGQGDFPGGGTFSGPAQLSEKLIESGKLDACAVRQLYTYAVGREPAWGAESRAVDALVEKFRQSDHALDALLLDFVADEAFALRAEAPIEGED